MSNLLEKASIITTPTAYSDGKLHSVKPKEVLGSELVTNGSFDTDSNWNKEAGGWSISGGTANGVETSTPIYQTISGFEAGKKYKVRFEVTSVTNGYIRVYAYAGASGTFTNIFNSPSLTTGVYESTFEFGGTNKILRFYGSVPSTGGFTGSIDNISVKEVTDADFDFQRGSAATRVNSQGLIENVQTLSGNLVQNGDFSEIGSEEIVNGDFATDSDWVYGTGWSISGGKAICDGGNENLLQSNVGNANKNYKIVFSISNYVSGSIRPAFVGQYSQSIDYNANGTYIAYISSLSDLRFVFYGSGFNGSIDNVSVKEVGQNWTLGTGWSIGDGVAIHTGSVTGNLSSNVQITSGKSYKYSYTISNIDDGVVNLYVPSTTYVSNNAVGTYEGTFTATNSGALIIRTNSTNASVTNISLKEVTDDTDLPRIDYTDGCGSLLLEPQSTNLVTYSEDFSNSFWSRIGVSAVGGFISPDGNNNAYKLVEGTGAGGHFASSTNISVTSGNYYTFSVFVKKGESNFIQLLFSSTTHGSNNYANFDLLNGVLGSVGNGVSKIESVGDFYKCSFTSQSTATTSTNVFVWKIQSLTSLRAESYTGDGTSGVYVWGAMLEEGSYPTSYIPTNGSTATRLADLCNNAGSSDLINSTEGVLYAEISANENSSGGWISLSNGTTSQRVSIALQANGIRLYIRNASGMIWDYIYTNANTSDYNKIGLKYKSENYALWINGIEVATNSSSNILSGLNSLQFDNSSGLHNFYGNVKSVVVYKEVLTNDELEGLTGEGYDTFNALALANNYTII